MESNKFQMRGIDKLSSTWTKKGGGLLTLFAWKIKG